MQKQITVIGATAGVGLLCVKQALEGGHKVIAISRNIDTLSNHPNLFAIKGNAVNKEDLKKSIKNSDSVIVTLGTGKSMKATTLYTEFAQALIDLHKENKIDSPFIILTGFGAGNSSQYQNIFIRIAMKMLLGAIYKNKSEMEETIASSSIKWEFVRPGILTDTALTGKYQVITNYTKTMKVRKIARADVANYLVNQAENPTNLGKCPILSY